MKRRLPILPAVAMGVLAAIAVGLFVAHKRDVKQHASTDLQPAPAAPPARSTADAPQAGALLMQASRQLAAHESVTAKVLVSSDLFGESLVATGQYLQGTRDSRRVRMDLKVQLGEKVCSLQQVCDGQALWIRRTSLTLSSLGRIDLPRALAGMQQGGYRPGVDVLALGGLSLILDSLARTVDFQGLRSEQLGRQPTFVIVGCWRNSMLMQFLPAQRDAIAGGAAPDLTALPSHVPNQIEIFLGRDDLFPYKIDFLRVRVPGERREDDRVLSSVKFVDVHFDLPLDTRDFAFQTGDTVPIDETQAFIDRSMVGRQEMRAAQNEAGALEGVTR